MTNARHARKSPTVAAVTGLCSSINCADHVQNVVYFAAHVCDLLVPLYQLLQAVLKVDQCLHLVNGSLQTPFSYHLGRQLLRFVGCNIQKVAKFLGSNTAGKG
eukprot:GHRR01013296.1.p1 GENE.GHRR01013296.1~~GHRR01013296.1.p1  ORF type:complete len:103 (+),score=7.87 GHRR01013296.1:82-390(+)